MSEMEQGETEENNIILSYYEAGDLEIYDESNKDGFYVYFESVEELAELIKTDPELARKLKELL